MASPQPNDDPRLSAYSKEEDGSTRDKSPARLATDAAMAEKNAGSNYSDPPPVEPAVAAAPTDDPAPLDPSAAGAPSGAPLEEAAVQGGAGAQPTEDGDAHVRSLRKRCMCQCPVGEADGCRWLCSLPHLTL